MTLEQFKIEARLNRGRLTKHTQDLTVIYVNGTECLKFFFLKKKLMGVKNVAWIALQPKEYQTKFCEYMANKNWKATKNELELWFDKNKTV